MTPTELPATFPRPLLALTDSQLEILMAASVHMARRSAIPALTGLRFLAAASVMVSHSVEFMLPPPGGGASKLLWYICLDNLAGIGMPLFFVLSGFVVHYNYSESIRERGMAGVYDFAIARFARLYPLFIVCVAFDLAWSWGYGQFPATTASALPFYVTLTQSWFNIIVGGAPLAHLFGIMPQIAWSISTEWFFYCTYPLLCLPLFRLRSTRAIIVGIASIVAMAVVAVAVMAMGWKPPPDPAYAEFRWFAYLSPYMHLLEFAMGCLVAALIMRTGKPIAGGLPATAFAAASVLVAFGILYPIATLGYPEIIAITCDVLRNVFGMMLSVSALIYCCARYRNPIVSLLSTPKLVLCGEASYSLYMLHLPVIMSWRFSVSPVVSLGVGFSNILMWVLMMASIVGLSLVSWQVLEMPARRALRTALAIQWTSLAEPSAAMPTE